MCTVCGCGDGQTRIDGKSSQHSHDHSHDHDHHHARDHHHYGQGPAHAHAPGMSQTRMVQIEQDILGKNQQYADHNRQQMQQRGILSLNLVSSPGSGKTTLLTNTLLRLRDSLPLAVIEGDQETAADAERIRETGVSAVQINTGKGCHLDAHMVGHAMQDLGLEANSVLFIENVGNLVCPAAFDLGETHRVAILSVTEGEDKPLKYPEMFHSANILVLNKIDLLPHLQFDLQLCLENALRINPKLRVFKTSATSGEGMQAWCDWLQSTLQTLPCKPDTTAKHSHQAVETN